MTQTEIDWTAVVVREEQVQSLLVGSPGDRVIQATQIANALAPVITDKHLYTDIGGKRHVWFEGWATLGALVGVFPITVETREDAEGAWARVEARTLSGAVVGAAEALCSRDEPGKYGKPGRWADAPRYAVLSMAQTRAGSKALRMPLGFIMQLAGFQATPAEEMDGVVSQRRNPKETDAERAELQKLLQRWVTDQGGPEAVIKLLGDNELPDVVSSVLTVTPDDKLAPVLGNLSADARESLTEYLKMELGE